MSMRRIGDQRCIGPLDAWTVQTQRRAVYRESLTNANGRAAVARSACRRTTFDTMRRLSTRRLVPEHSPSGRFLRLDERISYIGREMNLLLIRAVGSATSKRSDRWAPMKETP